MEAKRNCPRTKALPSSVMHGDGGVIVRACTVATGAGSLAFIDNVIADSSSRIISEVNRSILSAQFQPNASNLIGQCFIPHQCNVM